MNLKASKNFPLRLAGECLRRRHSLALLQKFDRCVFVTDSLHVCRTIRPDSLQRLCTNLLEHQWKLLLRAFDNLRMNQNENKFILNTYFNLNKLNKIKFKWKVFCVLLYFFGGLLGNHRLRFLLWIGHPVIRKNVEQSGGLVMRGWTMPNGFRYTYSIGATSFIRVFQSS